MTKGTSNFQQEIKATLTPQYNSIRDNLDSHDQNLFEPLFKYLQDEKRDEKKVLPALIDKVQQIGNPLPRMNAVLAELETNLLQAAAQQPLNIYDSHQFHNFKKNITALKSLLLEFIPFHENLVNLFNLDCTNGTLEILFKFIQATLDKAKINKISEFEANLFHIRMLFIKQNIENFKFFSNSADHSWRKKYFPNNQRLKMNLANLERKHEEIQQQLANSNNLRQQSLKIQQLPTTFKYSWQLGVFLYTQFSLSIASSQESCNSAAIEDNLKDFQTTLAQFAQRQISALSECQNENLIFELEQIIKTIEILNIEKTKKLLITLITKFTLHSKPKTHREDLPWNLPTILGKRKRAKIIMSYWPISQEASSIINLIKQLQDDLTLWSAFISNVKNTYNTLSNGNYHNDYFMAQKLILSKDINNLISGLNLTNPFASAESQSEQSHCQLQL